MKTAGLIYGNDLHYLDHIAPLSSLMNIPLIVTEDEMVELGRKYYPELTILYKDYLQVHPYLIQSFERVIYCFTKHYFNAAFSLQQDLYHKKIRTIWCPHGNSDKGRDSSFMEALEKEETALVYGNQMIDFMREKNVLHKLKNYHIIGNFRYQYYLKHRLFYHSLLYEEIFPKLNMTKLNFFYAPTWNDFENSGTFLNAFESLADQIPNDCNLIIKLHPNTFKNFNVDIERLIARYESHPGLLFLKTFPPIYPLLEYSDIFIGDMSSIGYDFLTFNKPMFFLHSNEKKEAFLFQCGVKIKPHQYPEIHDIMKKEIAKKDLFFPIRKKVYSYTFSNNVANWNDI